MIDDHGYLDYSRVETNDLLQAWSREHMLFEGAFMEMKISLSLNFKNLSELAEKYQTTRNWFSAARLGFCATRSAIYAITQEGMNLVSMKKVAKAGNIVY